MRLGRLGLTIALALASTHAAAAPKLGPELPLAPSDERPGRTRFGVAGGTGKYLVAWAPEETTTGGVKFVIVDGSGNVSAPIVAGPGVRPVVSFDGTNFLIVWMSVDVGSPTWALAAKRVSPDGSIIDAAPIPVAVDAKGEQNPAVDFDGTNYRVVWERAPVTSSSELRTLRLTPDGTVVDPNGVSVSPVPSIQMFPTVRCASTTCLVCWRRGGDYPDPLAFPAPIGDALCTRIGADGNPLEAAPLAMPHHDGVQTCPDSALWKGGWYVAWSEGAPKALSPSVLGTFGTGVGSDGTLGPSAPSFVATEQRYLYRTSIASDGSSLVIPWHSSQSPDPQTLRATITTADAPSTADLVLEIADGTGGNPISPSIASAEPGSFLVTYVREDPTDSQHVSPFARLLTIEPETLPDDGGITPTDASSGSGGSTNPDSGTPAIGGSGSSGGCGCRMQPNGNRLGIAAALLALGLALTRRRRLSRRSALARSEPRRSDGASATDRRIARC